MESNSETCTHHMRTRSAKHKFTTEPQTNSTSKRFIIILCQVRGKAEPFKNVMPNYNNYNKHGNSKPVIFETLLSSLPHAVPYANCRTWFLLATRPQGPAKSERRQLSKTISRLQYPHKCANTHMTTRKTIWKRTHVNVSFAVKT